MNSRCVCVKQEEVGFMLPLSHPFVCEALSECFGIRTNLHRVPHCLPPLSLYVYDIAKMCLCCIPIAQLS